MKEKLTALPLLPLTAAAGGLGLMLRGFLYGFCFDERGILSAGHPLHLACLVLAAVMLVYLALRVRGLGGSNAPEENFALSPWSLAAAVAAAYLTAQYGVVRLEPGMLNILRLVLTLLAAVSMPASLFLRDRRGLAFRVCLCLYFALEMLLRYRSWSGNPQLPDYALQVPACVAVLLCAYQRLAFDAELGRRRWLLYWGLAAIFLCLPAAVGPEPWEYYLAGVLWAFSALCRIQPPEA